MFSPHKRGTAAVRLEGIDSDSPSVDAPPTLPDGRMRYADFARVSVKCGALAVCRSLREGSVDRGQSISGATVRPNTKALPLMPALRIPSKASR